MCLPPPYPFHPELRNCPLFDSKLTEVISIANLTWTHEVFFFITISDIVTSRGKWKINILLTYPNCYKKCAKTLFIFDNPLHVIDAFSNY